MRKIVVLTALSTLLLAGCIRCTFPEQEEQGSGDQLVIMTWNIHNLFDGKDDGFEYAEFTQSGGWQEEKYLGRINSISAAVSSLHKKPDIILLQELESLTVLEDLASSFSGGYSWSHFAGNEEATVGVGIISRLPLEEGCIRAHSITIDEETSPRPVLEIRINIDDDPLADSFVIFLCHWKSKVGGDDKTEPLRRACARVILRRIKELWEEEPNLGVIVAGDLNTNHDDFYRRGAVGITALMPDDPYCADVIKEQNDFFILTKNKPPTPSYFNDGFTAFYSPWIEELENGTYYYMYNWETIDHFLLTSQFFNNLGWEYDKTEIISYHPFANAGGIPVGYNAKTGNGLSDHLPLMLTLRKVK